jgi:hypothetical protein
MPEWDLGRRAGFARCRRRDSNPRHADYDSHQARRQNTCIRASLGAASRAGANKSANNRATFVTVTRRFVAVRRRRLRSAAGWCQGPAHTARRARLWRAPRLLRTTDRGVLSAVRLRVAAMQALMGARVHAACPGVARVAFTERDHVPRERTVGFQDELKDEPVGRFGWRVVTEWHVKLATSRQSRVVGPVRQAAFPCELDATGFDRLACSLSLCSGG